MSWLKGRPTNRQIEPVDTAYLNYLDLRVSTRIQAIAMSSCFTKASRLIDHYFQLHNLAVPPSHTSLDVARHLESFNTATPAGLGADPALNLLLELHNPSSELYIESTRLLLSWL